MNSQWLYIVTTFLSITVWLTLAGKVAADKEFTTEVGDRLNSFSEFLLGLIFLFMIMCPILNLLVDAALLTLYFSDEAWDNFKNMCN